MTKKEKLILKNLKEFNTVTYKELERVRKYNDYDAEKKYIDLINELHSLITKLERELIEYKTAYENCHDCLLVSLSTVYSPKE